MSAAELLPFVYALAIGLLIGAERERSHPDRRMLAGSRTFAIVGLAGAVAAFLDPWVVVAALPVLGALMVVSYGRTSLVDPGTTTEVALLATYLLGAMTIEHAPLAAALGIVTTVLLMAKGRIHAFAREVLTTEELEDALKFLVLAFVVLPLLPDRNLGPYGVLNPHRIWLIVVTLTGISWIGYIAVRTLGPRRGLLVTGLAGGFISASATTATMARRSKLTGEHRTAVAAALLASIATFLQLIGVLFVASPAVAQRVWPASLAGAVVIAATAVLGEVLRRRRNPGSTDAVEVPADDTRGEADAPAPADRPFALRPALVLAAILTAALLVGRWAADVLGSQGAVLAAGAAGLADAHAGALAPASLHESGALTLSTALVAVGAAVVSNTVTKLVVAVGAGGRTFAVRFGLGMLPGVVAFVAVLAVTVRAL